MNLVGKGATSPFRQYQSLRSRQDDRQTITEVVVLVLLYESDLEFRS